MTTLRMPLDRRPIVNDSGGFPLGGSRDRRRGGARDDYPADARAALTDHARRSMGGDAFAKWLILLDYYTGALLGPDVDEGEGEPSAMDSRLDHRPSELAKMFPASINPKLAPNAGARDRDPNERSRNARLDAGESELSKLFPDAANPRLNYR